MHPMVTTITTTLLQRVRGGDQVAWWQIDYIYGPVIFRHLERWGIDDSDRADICQDTMVQAYLHIDGFQRDRARRQSFKAWLKRIADNKAKDFLKRKKPIIVASLDDVAVDEEEEETNTKEVALLFQRIVKLLEEHFDDRARAILERVVMSGECPLTVAESLGLTPNALHLRKSRLLKKLRAKMGELGELSE